MNAKIKTPASGYPLITKERTQKLDLLQHLVANIARAIVVCGPEGVGKTRLLKYFQELSTESCIFCSVKGDNRLSLEIIKERLNQAFTDKMPNLKFQSLDNAFERLAAQSVKMVLIIDDAGQLAPGLIEKIIAYANGRPILRCIFALTHSELYLKNSTDPAVDDCYQIEIPPLSEKQCGEFLEYLSTLPQPRVQFNSINETSVADLYRETHGIPGNILNHLPQSDYTSKKDYSKVILILAVTGLIAVALGLQWWSSNKPIESNEKVAIAKQPNKKSNIQQSIDKSKSVSESAKQQVENPSPPIEATLEAVKTAPPIGSSQNVDASKVEIPVVKSNSLNTPPAAGVETKNLTQSNDTNKSTETLVSENQQQTVVVTSYAEGERWIKGEPVENLTLQLMALPSEQAIIEVMQRNQGLGAKLRLIKTKTKSSKERFVLVYGSFTSSEEARKEIAILPKELQKTWVRKIGVIQQEIFTTTSSKTTE